MIRTILFDIDNTLYDYDRGNEAALRVVCAYCKEHFGWKEEVTFLRQKQARKDVEAVIGTNCAASHNRLIRFQRMLEKENLPLEPHVMNLYHGYWDTLIDTIEPTEDVTSFFRWAKETHRRIGIATNMTAYIQYKKLQKLSVLQDVDFMVTSEEVGAEKPDPAFFSYCMGKANCATQECLMIGDSLKGDVLGARNAGLQALWLQAYASENELRAQNGEETAFQSLRACREWIEGQAL